MSHDLDFGNGPSPPKLESSHTLDEGGDRARNQLSRLESATKLSSITVTDTVTAIGSLDPLFGQKRGDEGSPTPEVHSQHGPSVSDVGKPMYGDEGMTGAGIKTTNVTFSGRRIPDDVHAMTYHGDFTSNAETRQEPSTSLLTMFILGCNQVWTSMCSYLAREERPRDRSNAEQQSQHVSTMSTSPPTLAAVVVTSGSNSEEEQPPHEPITAESSSPTGNASTPGNSDCDPGNEKGEGKMSVARVKPQPESSHPHVTMWMIDNEELIITSIQVTDVALGIRRLPAGFYAAVHHSGLEWRTENKPPPVNGDIVEWALHIPIPSALSADIRLEVYGSFEFQPMLGDGEQLRKLTVKVEQLLERSARDAPFMFFPKNGDVVSPCSSVSVTVKRQKRERGEPSTLVSHRPHPSDIGSRGELDNATNQGHAALSRYRKHGDRLVLDHAIEEFNRALRICPPYHPGYAAAQSNLAMARFIHCQVDNRDASFEDPLLLYGNALHACPVGHVDRPSTLIQLAAVHLTLFEKRRDRVDYVQAEALLHEALELSRTGSHENRAAKFMLQLHAGHRVGIVHQQGHSMVEQGSASRMTNENMVIFSSKLLRLFERFGDLADLEQAIVMLKDLAKSVPVSNIWYSAARENIGVALWHRFKRLGELSDLEEAISHFKTAITLTPDGHPDKSGRLCNLGTSFRTRFGRLGELRDLQEAIYAHRTAVELTTHRHPGKPRYLSSLGVSSRTRFERLGEPSDLDEAIYTHRAAVDLTPDGHPDKPSYLNDLGISFRTRFGRIGDLTDLEEAIDTHKTAVDLTPHDHPHKPSYFSNLGTAFFTRFERFGDLSDLEEAILNHKVAIHHTPHDHPDRPSYLSNLGVAFRTRFERLGELSDIEESISTHKTAVNLTPDGHLDKPSHLNNLGTSFSTRFDRLGDLSDLKEAIYAHQVAVELTPHGHPYKPSCLSNLGNSFTTRFECLGELNDLQEAIYAHKAAADLTPHDHPNKPSYLNNLGNSFRSRFERLGGPSDIQEAIYIHKVAIDLTPHGHPHVPDCLSNLGSSFRTRFEHLKDPNDLKEAISAHKTAVDLTPHDHPNKPRRLSSLGTSFRARFECLGDLSDLQDAVHTHKAAADLTPNGHPHKPSYLSDLGTSFFTRFGRLREFQDLEEGISNFRAAVDLTPDGHPDKPSHLSNLGNSLRTRFECLGELGDIEDAIYTHKTALDLTPHGHPHKPGRLSNLGTTFRTRFEHFGELSNLEEAISTHKAAVDLITYGHPDKPNCLGNLGNSFRTRFERLRDLRDLDEAIYTHKAAVDLIPYGHPDKPGRLSNLGGSLRIRFEHLGELSDLESAISSQMTAVDLTPRGQLDRLVYLSNLGVSFTARFDRFRDPKDLEDAISVYSHAASFPLGSIEHRFQASRKWISCAHTIRHRSLLHAHSVAIQLLPQLAWIGLSLSQRYHRLAQDADVVREAAAAALDAGFPEIAVEWLEQGRSVVWGELLQLRSSYDELSFAHPDYAHRLRELSGQLEHASVAREQSLSILSEDVQSAMHGVQEALQQQVERHWQLAIERDKLLQEIRRLPGFERFLLQREFSQLRAAALSGPVVILNAAESRCDALIVLASVDHVIHVPLPDFSSEQSAGLRNTLKDLVRHPRAREGNRDVPLDLTWETFLSPLWKLVVKPVLDALAFSTPGNLSRIFWCPTGLFAFLPIHAAGFYDTDYSQPGHKVFDYVVSSYVPTLAILTQSHHPTEVYSDDLRLLFVRQPKSDGHSRLPGVVTELEKIKDIINLSSTHTTLVESSLGTVEEVLSLMKEADWVHFACHGIQAHVDSGLCLADQRRLKLRDIIALSRPRGGLAFLSACQTATGEERLADEAIHLAAGMLFAGYGGVIGTMWSISDSLAPVVAREVYGQLIRNGTRPDYRDAARALHDAMAYVRERGNASFDEWLPFIHVGL